jgi:MFS family permease
MGFIISPFLSPFAFGFLVARTTWRWAYGIGTIYGALVVVIIVLFGKETWAVHIIPFWPVYWNHVLHFRMYDRNIKPVPEMPSGRINALLGFTGVKMSKYRMSWTQAILSPLNVVWRPHILGILIFEVGLFTT